MQNTPHWSSRIPIGVYVAGAIVVLAVIGAVLGWLYIQWQALDLALPWLTLSLRILVFIVPPAYGLAFVWQRWGRTRYLDAHWRVMMKRAEVQVAPMAAHYHHEINTSATTAEQLALPAPIDVVKPMSEWLDWTDSLPHTLVSGRTKAGKTHTASNILARRLRAGETVYIIDPHSSAWLGLPTVGFVGLQSDGKPDTAGLRNALMAVAGEYIRRMKERDDHKNATGQELPHDHFGRLTVLIDEVNYIADVVPTVWREFARALASGGRKVGISLVCLVQSPLVEDIQISGGVRGNFARLALDDQTVKQLIATDEKDGERKKALHAALIGVERPAAATIDAQVWLLDRRNLDAGSAPPNARALVWDGKPSAVPVPEPPGDVAKPPLFEPPGTGSGTTLETGSAGSTGLEPLIKKMAAQGFTRNQMAATLGGNKQKTLALIRAVLGDAQ